MTARQYLFDHWPDGWPDAEFENMLHLWKQERDAAIADRFIEFVRATSEQREQGLQVFKIRSGDAWRTQSNAIRRDGDADRALDTSLDRAGDGRTAADRDVADKIERYRLVTANFLSNVLPDYLRGLRR